MDVRQRLERILGIRSDEEIIADVQNEAPIKAARAQLRRANILLGPAELREDLERADRQRLRRRRSTDI